jgi:hypothetical protein
MDAKSIQALVVRAKLRADGLAKTNESMARRALRMKASDHLAKNLEEAVVQAVCHKESTVLAISTEDQALATEIQDQLKAAGYAAILDGEEVRDPGGYCEHTEYRVRFSL